MIACFYRRYFCSKPQQLPPFTPLLLPESSIDCIFRKAIMTPLEATLLNLLARSTWVINWSQMCINISDHTYQANHLNRSDDFSSDSLNLILDF